MKENKTIMQNMHNNGKTYQEIGDHFSISRQRVYQILRDYNTNDNITVKNNLNIKNCQICNISKDYSRLHLHHKDKNWRNNRKENLMVICGRCHKMIEPKRKDTIKNYSYPDKVEIKCKFCNRVFLIQPSQKNKMFCNLECQKKQTYLKYKPMLEYYKNKKIPLVELGNIFDVCDASRIIRKYKDRL